MGGRVAMVDLNALIVFVKVAELKSFSAAAQALKMPLSTVSRRIVELEAQLGMRLLERSTRVLRLTEVGAEILLHARRSEEIGEAVGEIVADRLAHVRGLLRLSASSSIVGSLIAPLVIAFQRLHSDMRFEVDVTERDVDLVADGVDLAFRPRSTKDSTLVAVKILGHRPRHRPVRERAPRSRWSRYRARRSETLRYVRRPGGRSSSSQRVAR